MLNPVKLVTIDLDGTLVDSVPDLAYSVDRMMEALNLPVWGEDKVREWVGNGVETLVHRALTGELHQLSDEALFAKGYPVFLEVYEQHASERSRPYDGVIESLEWMKQQGYTLGCVTNKAARFTEPLCAMSVSVVILVSSSVAILYLKRNPTLCRCCTLPNTLILTPVKP